MIRLHPLLALAVAMVIGCADSATSSVPGDSAASNSADVIPATPAAFHSGQTVQITVPEMHCPFACYPNVKETLKEQPGIDSETIELVEQKEEAVINDPRIIVKLNGDLNDQQVIKAIAETGFPGATIVAVE